MDDEIAKLTTSAIAGALIRYGIADQAQTRLIRAFCEVDALFDRLGIPKVG